MFKLVGSNTSPYARRLRIFMIEHDVNFEFEAIDIYNAEQGVYLKSLSPILKIPILVEDNFPIFESRVIYNYLKEKLKLPKDDLEKENLLSSIDAATDSLLQLQMMKRSGIDIQQTLMYIHRQRARVQTIFEALRPWAASLKKNNGWDYHAISFFCLIDWALYRDLIDLRPYPEAAQFHEENLNRESVRLTKIV